MKKLIIISLLFICVLGCSQDGDNSNSTTDSNQDGQGGSLARFALLNDYLYTVDEFGLNVFNVATPSNPVLVNTVPIGFRIETLFNYKNYLYIGSRTGMYIYSVENAEFPVYLADVDHFTACDPVIANDVTAFITLWTDTGCGNNVNQLEIYDITNITEPVLLSVRNLIGPKGMGLYENYLIVCDDEIKIFDVSDPQNTTLVHSINRSAFDVIVQGDLLIAIGENGIYQYSLNNDDITNAQSLSAINF